MNPWERLGWKEPGQKWEPPAPPKKETRGGARVRAGFQTHEEWVPPVGCRRLTPADLTALNIGKKRKDGSAPQKWVLRTKMKYGGVQQQSNFARFVGPPACRFVAGFDGTWDEKAHAENWKASFCRTLNGEREPSKRALEKKTPSKESQILGVEALDALLQGKRQVAKAVAADAKRARLHSEMRKLNRNVPIDPAIVEQLASCVKGDANLQTFAKAITDHAVIHRGAMANDAKRRAEDRARLAHKKKRTEYVSYQIPLQQRRMLKISKWQKASSDLLPYVRDQTTDGIVLTHEGVDLSATGTDRILKKLTLVRLYCVLRLEGNTAAEAVRHCTLVFPGHRMSCSKSIYSYLKQYFTYGGFFETTVGKWTRENIWSNPPLTYAMKTFIWRKMYSVIKESDDPHDHKYFVAEHACQHLNKILSADPTLRCNKTYAAEFPIKVGVMRTWMAKVFDHHWGQNKKGTANQVHERVDAVQQREEFIFTRKRRQYQNLVWHHEELEDVNFRERHPHLYVLARLSRRVDAETDLCEKKYGDKVQAELMHNVHVYKEVREEEVQGTRIVRPRAMVEEIVEVRMKEVEMVEMHVDFLHIDHRWRAHPFWGGAMSVRCDLTKVPPPSFFHLYVLLMTYIVAYSLLSRNTARTKRPFTKMEGANSFGITRTKFAYATTSSVQGCVVISWSGCVRDTGAVGT